MGLNWDLHEGKLLLALDLRAGIHPIVEAALPADTDADKIISDLNEGLNRLVFDKLGPYVDYTLDTQPPIFVKNGRTKILKSRAERDAEWMAAIKSLSESCKEDRQEADDRLARNPDNGKFGYWKVEGMRHTAIVKACSAQEAIERAKDVVLSWELLDASYLGEDPDIIAC